MYRYSNGQISLSDFNQPAGMNLKESNRWVKKAQTIPWLDIEKRYAKLFTNRKGNVAKPLRLALGACIIQAEYGFSDEETALQIQENPYFQYFCGNPGYDDSKQPFDPSLMVYFRKRLTPEVLGEINEMILKTVTTSENNDDHNTPTGGGNSGTLIVDATCAPSDIRFPQDVSLLNEARENAEQIIDTLQEQSVEEKPRTYRNKAHKDSLKYMRSRKHNVLETLRKIYEQQKYMYDNHTHSVPDRIVSVSQPFIRPIVRGKAGKPVEFGAKLDISVSNGWARLEYWSFDAYNEATKLVETIERYRAREGHYPERVLADKIYRNRENLSYCKLHGIRLSGPALGRPRRDEQRDRRQTHFDQNERIEVERQFSFAKRKCNLGKVKTKLAETVGFTLAMSIVVLNLRKIQHTLSRLFGRILHFLLPQQKLVFVQ